MVASLNLPLEHLESLARGIEKVARQAALDDEIFQSIPPKRLKHHYREQIYLTLNNSIELITSFENQLIQWLMQPLTAAQVREIKRLQKILNETKRIYNFIQSSYNDCIQIATQRIH